LRRRGHRLVLTVEDDGPGVPEAERQRIFERFFRGAAAVAPGSGLGLAVVAQQVSLHDGEITVADSPLGGTRFQVRFPAPGQAYHGTATTREAAGVDPGGLP
jgi:signal transduction histidine kinase